MSRMTGFKKNSIAVAIATLAGVSGGALAQAEQDASLEEVTVLGIRGSLEKSMDVKRDAQGVVDAISAEDIGKFPDTNLAESMQRISGVSIDRVNGEGSKVTVRGLGPDFNLVTLNGRQLARTTGGRSFDFQNIASDMVTGVEVAKTSDATLPSGGMGATINLLTARPLETPERTMRFGVKGVMDESSDDASLTPEFSGFYSDTFADGKFGVAISGSVQERESGSQQALVSQWWSVEGQMDNNWDGQNDAWGAVPLENQVNRPGEGDIYSTPQNAAYKFEEQQRKRTNGQLVLQWAPSDDVTATMDYNYYKNHIAKQFNDISVYHGLSVGQEGVWSDGPISSPLIYSEFYGWSSDVAMGGGSSAEVNEGDMLGINVEWQVSDKLNLFFDGQHSEAERRPDSPYGTANVLTVAAMVRNGSSVDFTGEIPAIHVYTDNGINASDIQITGSAFYNNHDQSEVDQFRFGGAFELNDSSSIDFGISRQEVTNHSQYAYVQRNNWGGDGGDPAVLPDELFTAESIADKFDASMGDFSEIGGLEPLNVYYAWDFEAVRAIAEDHFHNNPVEAAYYGTAAGDCGTWFCASTDYGSNTDRTTTETSTAAYTQYNFASELSGMPYQVNAGLRYEQTDVDSVSVVPAFNRAQWASANEIAILGNGEQEYLSEKGEYDYWLPSLAFRLDVTDEVVARAAVSKAITRPDYESIKGGTLVGAQANPGFGGGGSTGNPNLKPFESVNYDLSVEWYYGETSYVSAGLFRKDVSNFITVGKVDKTVFNIANPADGALVDEARANGAVGSDAIRQYIGENYADSDFVDVTRDPVTNEITSILITGNPATDRDMVFTLDTPVNGDVENTIDGLELAVQHMFGETGFGLQANYTFVDSDLKYDPFLLQDQEAMVGLSDSANLVGFYDKNGFQARIAYNWRDEFLSSRGQGSGANPQYTDAYSQIDLNVSYEVPQLDGLQVFLEGINVTDESGKVFGRDKAQVLGVYEGGARWQVGARYAF